MGCLFAWDYYGIVTGDRNTGFKITDEKVKTVDNEGDEIHYGETGNPQSQGTQGYKPIRKSSEDTG